MHLALLIEYNGTNYAGWQIQPNGTSIQQLIENAIFLAFGERTNIVGSGRTDAGVHARGQVAHFSLSETANTIPREKVATVINRHLPRSVRILDAQTVEPEFHARFDAMQREYVYLISKLQSVFTDPFQWFPTFRYQPELLHQSGLIFEGTHNFSAFSKNNPSTTSYECNVYGCKVEEDSSKFIVRLTANRFVYGMCRAIVGAMMHAARGAVQISELEVSLQRGTREHVLGLAPANGLYLNRITYPNLYFSRNNHL